MAYGIRLRQASAFFFGFTWGGCFCCGNFIAFLCAIMLSISCHGHIISHHHVWLLISSLAGREECLYVCNCYCEKHIFFFLYLSLFYIVGWRLEGFFLFWKNNEVSGDFLCKPLLVYVGSMERYPRRRESVEAQAFIPYIFIHMSEYAELTRWEVENWWPLGRDNMV